MTGSRGMRRLDRALTVLEDALAWVAVAILIAITVIVSTDVMMRYLFNRPFSWAYDLISFYFMGALFYLAVSRTFSLNAHIGVDIVQDRIPKRLRLFCQMIVGVLSLLLFGMTGWVNGQTSLDDFLSGTEAVGEIAWPTWIMTALVVAGCTVISLRMALYAVQNMLALLGNPAALEQLDAHRRAHTEGARAE